MNIYSFYMQPWLRVDFTLFVWVKQNKYITNVFIIDEDEEITREYYNFMIKQDGRLCANRNDCSDWYAGSDSVQYMDSDRFIVEQCTGLRDINGNLIYEGDIVCENNDPYKNKYTVVFSYDDVGSCGCCVPKFDGCGFVIENSHGARGRFLNDDCEIIGNIHEQINRKKQ